MPAIAEPITSLMNFLHDSDEGFVDLANHATDRKYQTYFREEAQVRRAFFRELARALSRTHGLDSPEVGTRRGFLHRFWVNLKIELGAGDLTLIKTAVSCENEAVQAYQEALAETAEQDPLHPILQRHARHISRSLAMLEAWSRGQ